MNLRDYEMVAAELSRMRKMVREVKRGAEYCDADWALDKLSERFSDIFEDTQDVAFDKDKFLRDSVDGASPLTRETRLHTPPPTPPGGMHIHSLCDHAGEYYEDDGEYFGAWQLGLERHDAPTQR